MIITTDGGTLLLGMAFTAFAVNHLRQGLMGIRHDFYVWRLTRAARKAALRARHRRTHV